MKFDKNTGRFYDYTYKRNVLIEQGPELSLFRPLTDNDFGAALNRKVDYLKDPGMQLKNFSHYKTTSGGYEIVSEYKLLDGDASFVQTITIHDNGVLQVKNNFEVVEANHSMILKFGNSLTLPKSLNTFRWYGRGPWENYDDRKASAMVGIYEGSVKEQYHPYVRPQESGNKTDVRWAQISNGKSVGFRINYVDDLLNVSVLPYSQEQLYPASEKGQEHSRLLEEDKVNHLNVDLKQMGVAGINSWGSLPLEEYLGCPLKITPIPTLFLR
ncbi:beta-galactosidase small subunit [Antarcticibacterium sp. 1MA-6-2]|nr:beta-galactosidase small subunit [Antarcticibacterium sp. 1MA-6-2]